MADLFSRHDRHYHTLSHIQHLLGLADDLQFSDPVVIRLAIWFHDVIYMPRADSQFNEMQSILYLDAVLEQSSHSLSSQQVERVRYLIYKTADHLSAVDATDQDLLLFLDMDLSILSESPALYSLY